MRQRVPFIPQMEAVECGAAALAMVLAYHGCHAPLSEVRQACGISRDGSTAKNIVVAARSFGLVPRALRVEPSMLEDCEVPAILHWDMNHFVVLERWTPRGSWIVDPGVGRRRVSPEAFDESFTGVCIELECGDDFEERARARVSLGRYAALLRGAGRALAIVLFASLALDALATALPLTLQVVIDHVLGRHRVDWLFLVVASAAGLVTFTAAWSLLRGSLLLRLRARLDAAITRQFVGHLLQLRIAFFGQRSVADLMVRVQANGTIRDVLAGQSIGLLADGVMLMAYLGLMFFFDHRLSWFVLSAGALYVGVFLAGRPLVASGTDEAQRKDVIAGSALLEILRGITTLKSAGVEENSHRRWLNAWIASLNANGRVSLARQTLGNVLLAIEAAVPVAILLVGGRRVLAGELTPGRLVAFQMLQAGFLLPLQGVVSTLLRLQIVPILLGRMDDVLLSETEPARPRKSPRLMGEIELRDVRFRYSPTGPEVLKDISLRIPRGKKVALVGRSGSGKSTLARLLLGLYAPTGGEVLLDGVRLDELDLASVRRQYGVVLQETALFDGTVADNLRLFSPGAPLEHVVQAARVAQIHDDILALPRGYETRISGRGGALSGGQRQRLALARAIVHRPPIMVLDEATSALDAVTEAAVERYLSTRACTRIVIAHRLSTVRDADTIFVVDGGTIAARGRHDELLAAGGLYAELLAAEQEPAQPRARPAEVQRITATDLESFDAFAAWSAEARGELADVLQRADFPEGARVVEQDSRAAGLYLIVEGTVGIELAEPGLAAWTVAELGPGGVFGEISLLDGSPSSASVVARARVRLLHLPYARFHELQRRGDVLAARATLTLGGIVAARMRDAVRRHAETVAAAKLPGALPDPRAPRDRVATRELPLAETLLGASLDEDEVARVERGGSRLVLAQGARLFEEGGAADTLFVLLRGHVALERADVGALAVLDPGAIFSETCAFDAGVHETSAVALGEVAVLSIDREALVALLLSGQNAARKLLAPITDTLVRRFRLANFRLREAIALERGELDRAHAAREQAIQVAREEREALLVEAGGQIPVVMVRDVEQSGAACLTAMLRATSHPVSLSSVVEAFSGYGAGTDHADAIPSLARSFGLTCRRLDVPLEGLRAMDAPILARIGRGKFVVLESYALGAFRVMDPLRGRVAMTARELSGVFSMTSFEVRDDSAASAMASLPERALAFARARRADLIRLLAVSVSLQCLALGTSLATAVAVQRVFPLGDRPLLTIVVGATVALTVAYVGMQQLQVRAIEHLRAHFDRELLDQLMTHLLKLPVAFFDRMPPGEVLQRFQAFENVRMLFSAQGITALLNVASLGVGGALLLSFGPRLVVVPAAVLILYALTTRLLFPSLLRAAVDGVAARGAGQDRLIEILQGIVTLRMAGDPSAAEQRWLPAFLEELAASLKQDRVLAFAAPLLDWVRGLAMVVSVWLGARGVLSGTLSVGGFVAFLALLATTLGATHALAMQVLSSARSLVDYGMVRSTFLEPREQTSLGLLSPGELRGRVTVDQVSFRYTEDGPYVLKDVSLQIESGMKVALVGASGSGKSTLGRLLLGLYLPTSGRILFDGKDVTSLDLEALRRRMGVVLQEPFLMTSSIRDNIALGAEGVTLEQIEDAADRAAIREDILAMTMGYETLVAEGGGTFSGGQRQRLAIARAIVSSPAVLLLDEATSALDNLSQAVIERHLARGTATRIVIAHRLSTIVDADWIVVLARGRVVEQGKHEELCAQKGAYFDLVRAQL